MNNLDEGNFHNHQQLNCALFDQQYHTGCEIIFRCKTSNTMDITLAHDDLDISGLDFTSEYHPYVGHGLHFSCHSGKFYTGVL